MFLAMHSLWTLAQQAEYVYMIQYGQSVHIPKLVGSCGHMYAMEYLPTPKLLHPSIMNLVHSGKITYYTVFALWNILYVS